MLSYRKIQNIDIAIVSVYTKYAQYWSHPLQQQLTVHTQKNFIRLSKNATE